MSTVGVEKKWYRKNCDIGRVAVSVYNHLDGDCCHGPQRWPWWKLVSFSWLSRFNCDLYQDAPKSANMRRLWVYFRWPRGQRDSGPPLRRWKGEYRNRALCFDFVWKRRSAA